MCPKKYFLPFELKKTSKAYSTKEKLPFRIESSIE
jgi:hypothetical protein